MNEELVGELSSYVRRTYNPTRLLLDHDEYELVSGDLK